MCMGWILDSGCTDHIVNDDSFFGNFINLKDLIKVEVADGRILEGTKIGKVNACF